VAVFLAILATNILLIWRRTRPGVGIDRDNPTAISLRNALMVAIIAYLFSPLLFAPAWAVVTVASLMMGPLYARPRAIVFLIAVVAAAVLVPWGLEVVGLKASSITLDHGAVILHPKTLADRSALWFFLVAYVVGIVAAVTPILYSIRRKERERTRLLHVQAWHLRQLVQGA
jgi:hypothetical protein